VLIAVAVTQDRVAGKNLAELIFGVADVPTSGFGFPYSGEELAVGAGVMMPGTLYWLSANSLLNVDRLFAELGQAFGKEGYVVNGLVAHAI
jgi:hypothetical protein